MTHERADGGAPGAAEERAWALEAVAGISDALIVFDEQARLVYRNPAAERLIGGEHVAPVPSRWIADHGLFAPDEETHFAAHELPIVRALEAGEEVHDVAMFIKNTAVPRGVHVLVSASPLRGPSGDIHGAACIIRDLTRVREQETRLREGARQKQAILDNIPDMAWLKDERGRFVLVNQPLATAAGRASPDDLVGLTDRDLWPCELAERYSADDREVMQTRGHKYVEEPFVDKQGTELWIETVKKCIVDDEGRVIGTTGIARDVTERKRTEEKMRRAQDELEQRVLQRTAELAEAQEHLVRQERLAVLGQLAGGVAHQIRNPLAAIMNATYVLKRHLLPDQHQNVEDAIRIIHVEVRHANVIITGLLDYARVRTPDRHPTSLVDLLERILAADWFPGNIRVKRVLPVTDDVIREIDAG